jgi:hypothetical protein
MTPLGNREGALYGSESEDLPLYHNASAFGGKAGNDALLVDVAQCGVPVKGIGMVGPSLCFARSPPFFCR